MDNDSELLAARNEALRKIGRNLVNFQKMEAMLKFILASSNYSLPMSQVPAHLEKQTRSLRARPMGDLIELAAKLLHGPPLEQPKDIAEPWVTTTFTFTSDGPGISDWRREMREVVRERNRLVHNIVSIFDHNSLESCKRVSCALDEQREKVMPAYKHLESVAMTVLERIRYLAEHQDEIVTALVGGAPSDA